MNRPKSKQMPGLLLDQISKSYSGNQILHNLSLSVPQGELLSLLGPSGCGKTTTLNLIAGFEEADAGAVILDGVDITRQQPNHRDTAIVFQNYALFPHMTVGRNVAFGLMRRGLSKSEIVDRVDQMLDMMSITALRDRYPGQLSGGQQQRVSLARALAVRPSLVLFDEPLSNLDAKLRQEVRTQIRQLQMELKQTAVFVTHDQEEALAISDKIAVLNAGRLEQLGTPDQIWSMPRTVYVADFMGVANIIPMADAAELVPGLLSTENRSKDRKYSHVGFRPNSATLVGLEEGHEAAPQAVVRGRTYLGNLFQYDCELVGKPTAIKIELAPTQRQFEAGEAVRVLVDPERLLYLESS